MNKEVHTADNQLHDMITPTCEEYYGDDKYGTRRLEDEEGHKGWPGDFSGMDDLADYNQLEGGDY